jgi:serine protease DegQ
LELKEMLKHQEKSMSSTGSEVWELLSRHAGTIAEQSGKAVVAVDGGHRVAASGVHWKPGVVITASHLVRGATEVSVLVEGGTTLNGRVAGRDSASDLAAIRVDNLNLPVLPRAATARVGELVLGVARSGRGELSASAGIVARVGEPWRTWRNGKIDRLLRPDIRLYPGQSGSALVNGRGELLGINSAVLARQSVITVPNETVDRVADELLERGHVAQPYLGVAMQPVSLPEEWRNNSAAPDQEHGLLVVHVVPDSPAKLAGINIGDVIISVDGQAVHGPRQLHQQLTQKRTGEKLMLRVVRSGKAAEVEVTLGDRPRRA